MSIKVIPIVLPLDVCIHRIKYLEGKIVDIMREMIRKIEQV
mgnify:CR=1 FL=1